MVRRFTAIVLLLAAALFILPAGKAAVGEKGYGVKWIEVHFSPEDGCAEKVVREIARANEYVHIAMYYFSRQDIAQAVVEARNRGVEVKVFLDKSQYKRKWSKSRFLINEGVPVRFHTHYGLMHNKFCVIDGERVLTGSFNWTKAGNARNDENFLIISDPEIARVFEEKFWRLWKTGELIVAE